MVETKTCPVCAKEFTRGAESALRWERRIYCGRVCARRGRGRLGLAVYEDRCPFYRAQRGIQHPPCPKAPSTETSKACFFDQDPALREWLHCAWYWMGKFRLERKLRRRYQARCATGRETATAAGRL